MLRDITFGQYYAGNSLIHRTDPRLKILLLILFIVFTFVASNAASLGFAAASALLIVLLTQVPLRMYFKNLKAILPVLIFTAIINAFYGGGRVLFSFWRLSITTGGVYRAVFMSSRIALLIFISSALTYTTTPNALTDAIESLLSPLKYVGLKSAVHTLAMMMTIALRFIPTLTEEAEKIMNAQKARGADLENGKLTERVKALIPVLIPLLISAVRRAYELAEAMECRCYNGGEGKTRMRTMHIGPTDIAVAGASVLLCAGVVTLNILF